MNGITNNTTLRSIIGTIAIGVVASLPLISASAFGDPYQAPRAALAALALIALLLSGEPSFPRGWKLPAGLLAVAGGAYLISGLLSGPASAVFGVHGRFQGILLAVLAGLAMIAGASAMRSRVMPLVWAVGVVGALQAIVLGWQRINGLAPTGTTANAVLTGGWLAIAASVSIAASFTSQGVRRWWLLGLGSLAALGVGMTGSRGAWVGLCAGLVVVVAVNARRTTIVAVGVIAVLAVGVLLGGPAALGKLDPSSMAEGSAATRTEIWKGTARMIAEHPVFGVGPGRFLYEYPRYDSAIRARIESGDVRADQAHSELLHVAAEAGVPVALSVAALILFALYSGIRAARRRDAIGFIALAGSAAYIGQAAFGIATVESLVLGWMLCGVAISRREPEPQADQRVPVPTYARFALVGVAIAVLCVTTAYLLADARFASSQRQFADGRMERAYADAVAATRALPSVDVYRVAQSDAALYLGGYRLDEALSAVESGLSMEPDSYDLLLARARLLGAMRAPAGEVADAYMRAVAAYPNGVEVRKAAADALRAADRPEDADRVERAIRSVLPAGSSL